MRCMYIRFPSKHRKFCWGLSILEGLVHRPSVQPLLWQTAVLTASEQLHVLPRPAMTVRHRGQGVLVESEVYLLQRGHFALATGRAITLYEDSSRISPPSKLIRKLPLMMFASVGVSLGSSVSRVVWEAIIISLSSETLEVSSACRASINSNSNPGSIIMTTSYSKGFLPEMDPRKESLIAHAPSMASSMPGFFHAELALIQPVRNTPPESFL